MTDINEEKLQIQRRILLARQADQEQRKPLLHDPIEEVLHALLDNAELTEDELIIITQRKELTAEMLKRLAADRRVQASYPLKRHIIIHPKTPASISLGFLGHIFTFDLLAILLVPHIPREVKTAGDEILCRKYPQLAVGEKLTLARRTNSERLLNMLLDDTNREVVAAVLTNSFLKESIICTILRKATSKPHTVELVALNPKWSCRYDIRYALLRNRHLSLGLALNFLQTLIAKDLRDLSSDPHVSMQIRSYIKTTLLKPGGLTTKNRLN